MYSKQFIRAAEASANHTENGIGTYMERSQHRVLKFFFEPDATFHEIPVSSYIADICKDDQIYEIQTSGFGNLTSKLEAFLIDHKVSVVYPAPITKTVIWTDPLSGDITVGRKTTKTSVKYKLLSELIYINHLIGHDNFNIIIAETEVNSIRLLDGVGKDKKIKATKLDTVPTNILALSEINNIDDIKSFIDVSEGQLYSRAELQKKFQLKGRKLSLAIKSLLLLGIIKESKRENRKIIYVIC